MKRISGLILLVLFFLVSTHPAWAISGTKKVYLNATADSEVIQDEGTANYGRRAFFSAQSTHGSLGLYSSSFVPRIYSLMRFDLASIPSGSYIQSANLKLYAYRVTTDAPCELQMHKIDGDWNETQVTWNNLPRTSVLSQYHYIVNNVGYLRSTGDEGWEITGLVRKWHTAEYLNFGLLLKNLNDGEDSLCKFFSRDETVAANLAKKPQLIVEYVPPVKFTSVTVPTSQITTKEATFNWSADGPIITTVYYRPEWVRTEWTTKLNRDTLTSNRVVLDNLSPNTRYVAYVSGRDDADRTVESEKIYFTTKKPITRVINPDDSRQTDTVDTISNRIGNMGGITGSQPPPEEHEPDTSSQNQNNDIKIIDLHFEIGLREGTFFWTTKEEDGSSMMALVKTSGFVYLGEDNNVSLTNHIANFGKSQGEFSHTVNLINLDPDTTYYYLVYSKADDGRIGEHRGTFTTQTAPSETGETEMSADTQNYEEDTAASQEQGNDETYGVIPPEELALMEERKRAGSGIIGSMASLVKPGGMVLNWPLIVLISLIVILLILLLTRKKKPLIEEKVQKPKAKTEAVAPEARADAPKKSPSLLFKIAVIVFILFMLANIISLIGALSPLAFSPLAWVEMLQEKNGATESGLEAETTQSIAKLETKQTDLKLAAADEREWPKGTVGGLYRVEPSGNFSSLAAMTVSLTEPVKGFALGYYHPETKKWEYIPTIRIFGNTYKALIAHASEIGGYAFGLEGALEYDPEFSDPELQQEWESLKTDLQQIAELRQSGRDTSVEERLAERKLDQLATRLLGKCAGSKTFANQMDYFFIWHIAQLINATAVDEKLGEEMDRCIDMKAIRTDSKYEYMIRDRQTLDNDLNVPETMQLIWKGTATYEGYPILSGYGNTDWRTDWQVLVQTEYGADIEYGSLFEKMGLPTPEGTSSNNKATSAMLFSLKNIREGNTFKIRGVTIGDAPGYFRNWHEDFKWRINHPSTSAKPETTDPNKHVFEMSGTLMEDNGKNGAVIKISSMSDEQKAQVKKVAEMFAGGGSGISGIPAYFQELTADTTLKIVRGISYNE